MSGFRDIAKGGWHPKAKDGRAESWRGDFKGINQVAGWVGKGKDTSKAADEAKEHYSAPLSTLKDPAAFGPPPKHRHYHGAAASPSTTTPDTGGWGAPVPDTGAASIPAVSGTMAQSQQAPQQQEETQRSAPPPLPYRANTTGLKTDNLPKPPVRRIDPNVEPGNASAVARQPHPIATTAPRPTPPPRLPARQNSHPDAYSEPPPPAYQDASHDEKLDEPAPSGFLNQGSINRLGNAGVAVPGFNIGRQDGSTGASTGSSANNSQLNELQQRFAQFRGPSSTESQSAETPTSGTTWAQKRGALQTASKFQQDPSSVSISDARQAVSTANNFRQRHGEQVAAGVKTANSFNQKYGVADRVGGLVGPSQNSATASEREAVNPPSRSLSYGNNGARVTASDTTSVVAAAAAKKAPPPPPPPKKRNLTALPNDEQSVTAGAAPPVPFASRPR